MQAAARTPGRLLETTEERKRRAYATELARAGNDIAFVPFIVDEFGSIGDHGQQLLLDLAVRREPRDGSARAALLRTWRMYVAVAVHRTQAQIIMMMSARAGKHAHRHETDI